MDLSGILGILVRGALGAKRKKGRKALRWLSSGRGSPLLTSGALITAAGVAWGLFETWQNQQKQGQGPGQAQGQGQGQGQRGEPGSTPVWSGRPAPAEPAGASPSAATASAARPAPTTIDPILRLVRLTVAAARADGALSDRERETILDHARQAGVEDLVLRELETPVPLAEIVGGVSDPTQKKELYALAFTIVRADEDLSQIERLWLAQLAVHLGLDPAEIARIESGAAASLDAVSEA